MPGLALARIPAEKNIMQRPPRQPTESIFAHGLGWHILWVGLLMGGLCLGIQAWAIQNGRENGQTMVFTVLCFSQLGHALAIQSDNEFLIKHGLWRNKALLAAVALTFLLQLALIYIPSLQKLFSLHPLTGFELLVCTAVSGIVFHGVEFEKYLRIRIQKSEQ
jgi:Ca2+-transporting ATPase